MESGYREPRAMEIAETGMMTWGCRARGKFINCGGKVRTKEVWDRYNVAADALQKLENEIRSRIQGQTVVKNVFECLNGRKLANRRMEIVSSCKRSNKPFLRICADCRPISMCFADIQSWRRRTDVGNVLLRIGNIPSSIS